MRAAEAEEVKAMTDMKEVMKVTKAMKNGVKKERKAG
jgi:hypothetical protein